MLAHLLIAAAAAVPLFGSYDNVSLELKAPFNELFENARSDDDSNVSGTLTYVYQGRRITIDDVRVSVRGHTSRNASECSFPKLKVAPHKGGDLGPLLAGLRSIRIGTHCGEAAADDVSMKYGRLPNQLSPLREAFVYRLLDAVGVPSLKARPATVSYVYDDAESGKTPAQDRPVVRRALILEEDDDAIARLGGDGEISEAEFSDARAQFTPDDTVRLIFAEALIGNFDWCLKMTPDDRFRCDARHPLWNITAVTTGGGRARPLIHDFDVAGMVTGRHPWFEDVFNAAFSKSNSQAEVEVVAQLQRTRALFPRAVLDRARAAFAARRADADRALESADMDDAGRRHARKYMDAFFDAMASDDAFYRPVVSTTGARMYANTEGEELCPDSGSIPVGTPVSEPLQRSGELVQVRLLDSFWHWTRPARCAAARKSPVWIKADVVSADYPRR